jgi:hypothetical protein
MGVYTPRKLVVVLERTYLERPVLARCKLFTLLSTPYARLNVDGTVLMRPLS